MKKALTEQTRSPVLVSLESVELCVPAIPRMTNKREQVPVTNIVETAGKQSFTPLIFHGNTPKMQDRWFKAFAKVCAEVTSSFTLGMYPIGLSSSFLSHIIFNMPSSSRHIENAACALHMNGGLVAFNPSITQMMSIVEIIKRKNLPLHLDQIVELGHTMTVCTNQASYPEVSLCPGGAISLRIIPSRCGARYGSIGVVVIRLRDGTALHQKTLRKRANL